MSPRKREVNSKFSHSGTASTENFTHGNSSSEPHIEKQMKIFSPIVSTNIPLKIKQNNKNINAYYIMYYLNDLLLFKINW